MRSWTLALISILLSCAAVQTAPADPPRSPEAKFIADAGIVGVIFTEDEIRIIREYYEENASKGRGKGNKGLPPGIAKNLARGKPLPPGIAKRELPQDLRARLPRAPSGYERIIVDGKVLLIEIATQVVRDILTDVLR